MRELTINYLILQKCKYASPLVVMLLIAFMMLTPTRARAQTIGLTVGGVAVTSDNAENIFGDINNDNEKPTASFKDGVLTLNGANIFTDVSASEKYAIESGLENLTIYLEGENIITCQGNSDIAFKGTTTGAKITFATDNSNPGSLSIQVNSVEQLFNDITPVYPAELSLVSEGYSHTIKATEYDLSIGTTKVTVINASNITGTEIEGGTVTFTPADDTTTPATPATLTLDNATLKHGIISSLENLRIRFKGTNKINTDGQSQNWATQNAATDNAIMTEVETATLTFEKDGEGSLELYSKTTSYNSVISGFASVNYGSDDNLCYLHTSSPSHYDAASKALVNIYNGGNIVNATISDQTSYPLWFISAYDQGTQVTSTTVTTPLVTAGTVTFNPSNNTLSLDGVTMEGKILSRLGNLTLDIKGANYIATQDSGSTIRSACAGALTIKKRGENASLQLKTEDYAWSSYPVIQGFTTLSYEGLNLGAEDVATYGAYEFGDVTIYGLYNPNKTEGYEKRIASALFTTGEIYPLYVGGTIVSSDNASNITGDAIGDTGSISFDAESNTLTLDNASIDMSDWEGFPIKSGLADLKIKLIGENSVRLYSDLPCLVQYSGVAEQTTPQLTFATEWGLNKEEKLCLGSLNIEFVQPENYEEYIANGYTITNTFDDATSSTGWKTTFDSENENISLYYIEPYDLWISGIRVTSENASNIWGEGTDLEFDAANSTLYYRSGGSTSYPVLSGLPNLTIKIGSPDDESNYTKNNIGVIKFGAPEGAAIAATSGTLTISKILDDAETVQQFDIVGSGEEPSLIQGFTTVDFNDFIVMADGVTYNTETKKLEDANGNDWCETATFITPNGIELSAPEMSSEPIIDAIGQKLTLSSNYNYGTIKYSVDYVDANETDITDATYDPENEPTICKPATVTAYVTINGHNSTTTKGKYFDSAENPLRLVYNAAPIDLVLAPAIEESDGISITGIEANVTYDSSTGKISSSTLGSFGGPVAMSFTEGKTVILNNYFTMNFEVVPPAPTITSSATLEGDPITIESTIDAEIYYSWSAEDAEDNVGTLYSETAPTAQTGTLYAWVTVTTENGTVTSDKATKEFSVKKDLANAYIPEFATSAQYTGNAIVPTFSVYESESLTSLISSDNYTISYRNLDGESPVAVESMVDAGTYDVEIIAKESSATYGGSIMICEEFIVTKANAEITTTPKAKALTFTNTAQALVETGVVTAGTMKYSKSLSEEFTEAIPEETNAGTYTVYYKVDGNKNYNGIDASETNKVSVSIIPATITEVTLTENSFIYDGESKTVEIATVKAGTLILTKDNTDFAKTFNITGNSATDKGTYTLTVEAKENSNYIGSVSALFSIINRTASEDEFVFADNQTYATYINSIEDIELPASITAYIITGVSGTSVTTAEMKYVPKNVPVLVEKRISTERPENNPEATNMLHHVTTETTIPKTEGTAYILYNGYFVRVTDNIVTACYLLVPANSPSNARALSIKHGDNTTAIESLKESESSDTERWYDIQGRRIEQPFRAGLYIRNGKMVVIK